MELWQHQQDALAAIGDAQEWLRQYIIETFGAEIATDRLHEREGR